MAIEPKYYPYNSPVSWDTIEISQVYENTDEKFCERIDDPTELMLANVAGYPIFWSVYLHLITGEVQYVADLPDEESARALGNLLLTAASKYESPWISVKDRLPEPDTQVLVLLDYRKWKNNIPLRIEKANVWYTDVPRPYGGPYSLTGSGHLTGTYFSIPAVLHPDTVTYWKPLPKISS